MILHHYSLHIGYIFIYYINNNYCIHSFTSLNRIMENNTNINNTNNNGTILPMSLIHYIFDTYLGVDYKLLIHKEGSTDEDRSKVLSIELIMISRMEDYFVDVLLSPKFVGGLCDVACKRGYVNTLKWAREHGCYWTSDTCRVAAYSVHLSCLQWAREHGIVMSV